MSFRWSQRFVLAIGVLTALLGVGSTGCLGERPAINQVQPDFLDKEQLIPVQFAALQGGTNPGGLTQEMIRREPTWVHQITIIDKPATTGMTGISWYTDMQRVNWEVTEGFLIARHAYDRLNNGQFGTNISNNPRQGEILAVYRISSHFDIRRSYNPGTGEEMNVIVENTSDRPWYQRRYMRIDWTQNLVSGYSAMSYAEWQGRVRAEPGGSTWVNDPSDPNRPVFNYGTFNGQQNVLTYFDVTNRAVLHPEEINLAEEGYPNIPACLLIDRAGESCQPADVTMRVSFMRLDPSRDYQPQALDGHRMDRFGFFEGDRVGFDRDRNERLNTTRRHLAFRHNLWMQHHASPDDARNTVVHGALDHLEAVRDANGFVAADVSCSTDTDCLGVSATARCDAGTRTCGERYVRCTNDQQCAATVGFNSTCDQDIAVLRTDRDPARQTGYGLCLLPYRRRQVRAIPYHLSPNYPASYMLVTNDVAADWNRQFSHAVQQARRRECLIDPATTDRASCDAYVSEPGAAPTDQTRDSQHVFVACHNPVWGTEANRPGGPNPNNDGETQPRTVADVEAARARGWDTEACGPQGTSARLGDIRYSMMAQIPDYDVQGSWGLANISGDPETGEVYSGRGAVWQTVTELQAAWATDVIRVLNGDLTPEQIANGENIVESYQRETGITLPGGLDGRQARQSSVPRPRRVFRDISSREELETILAQTNFTHLTARGVDAARASASGRGIDQLPAFRAPVDITAMSTDRATGVTSERNFLRNAASQWSRNNALFRPGLVGHNRLDAIRGTQIERMMMNSEQMMAAGFAPDAPITQTAIENASPARQNNQTFRALQRRIQSAASAHQCNYEAEFDDEVVATLVHRFRANTVPPSASFGREWNFRADGENDQGNPNLNYDEIRTYLRSFIHRGVMAHEIGHSIGQRHNFGGSADAVNYRDEYWQLRGQGHRNGIVPRFQHMADGENFYSNEELEGGVEEYGYASVMDYKGFNEDAHGLGRYERAFVLHGYVNMVEAFDTVADESTALNMFQTIGGGGQQTMSFGLVGSGSSPRLTSYHYTDIPRVVGQVSRNGQMVPNVGDDNRFTVFLNETSAEAYNAFNWAPDHTNVANANRDGTPGRHLLVPYRFATDDQAGYLWYNQRYDAGADMFESMHYGAVRYLDYYFANSFSRERSSFTVNGYRNRMTGRYLDNLYYVMRLSSIYEVFYADIFGSISNRAEWERQPAIQSNRLGVATVMDTFAQTITLPESSPQYGGQHTLRTRFDGTRVYEVAGFGDGVELDVAIGDGRQFETRYDWASGHFWRDRLYNAGSYHDKTIALEYMADTFLYAIDRTFDVSDIRSYQVNAYTVYPAQTIRFFGSLLSQDHGDVGPQVRNPGPRYQMLHTRLSTINLPSGTGMGQNGRDPALNSVDPNLGFTGELYTAVFAMAGFSGTFDQRFIQNARLWADGDDNAIPTGAGTQLVDFTDPQTGIVYHAIHLGAQPGEPNADVGLSARDRARNAGGVAERMIVHANDLRAAMEAATGATRTALARRLQQYVDLLNVMRSLNTTYSHTQQGQQ